MSENNSDDDEIRIIKNDRFKNQIEDHIKNDLDSSLPTIRKMNLYKKKEYQDVVKSLTKYYEYDNKYTSKLDILITYMRGQKNIYSQSKNITHLKLYLLMIPTLILSALVSIMAPMIIDYKWGGGFISGINVVITSFITMMNYFKLESTSEMFLQLTNQYDKLEVSLEMANNKLIFLEEEDDKNELVLRKLNDIELKLNELKEVYNLLIPNEIIPFFPIICNINIFSMIKYMEKHKKQLIYKFMDVKNEIRYILHKWKRHSREIEYSEQSIEKRKERNRLLFLYDIKEKIKTELNDCKNVYTQIDVMFSREIKKAGGYSRVFILLTYFFRCLCYHFDGNLRSEIFTNNTVLNEYFQTILLEE
jgi:hypothetical protein